MSISRFLTHRVSIIRRVAVLVDDEPSLDEYGQPITAESTTTDVPASIQPRTARERAEISQGGAAVSDHRIYMLPLDIGTADLIVHDPDDCPMWTDLPLGRYEVMGVPDAAGAGHHVEIEARLVGSASSAYALPVGETGS